MILHRGNICKYVLIVDKFKIQGNFYYQLMMILLRALGYDNLHDYYLSLDINYWLNLCTITTSYRVFDILLNKYFTFPGIRWLLDYGAIDTMRTCQLVW